MLREEQEIKKLEKLSQVLWASLVEQSVKQLICDPLSVHIIIKTEMRLSVFLRLPVVQRTVFGMMGLGRGD